jgi:hypothetical protein
LLEFEASLQESYLKKTKRARVPAHPSAEVNFALKTKQKQGVVAPTCNPVSLEVKAGGSGA